jgi:hypothetical protein
MNEIRLEIHIGLTRTSGDKYMNNFSKNLRGRYRLGDWRR